MSYKLQLMLYNSLFPPLFLLLDGHAQLLLQQIQTSVTKEQYKTARMDCKISGLQNFKSAVIHWYQQISSRAPEWILFISESEPSIDQHFDKNKFHCEKDPNKQISTLTVNDVTHNDTATYYCAAWDHTALTNNREFVQIPILKTEPQPF